MSKARKIRDIVAKTGEYTDKNGNTKGRYTNAGSLFYNDEEKSFFIILNRTFNPAGVPNFSDKGEPDSVFLSCFDPDRNNNNANTGNNYDKSGGDYASASGHYSRGGEAQAEQGRKEYGNNEQDPVPF